MAQRVPISEQVMVTTPTSRIVTKLAGIDSQLADLYRRAAGEETMLPVTRTVLLNLIVYTSGEREMEEVAADVSEVVGSHPCRAIIVDAVHPGPDGMPAAVSAVCGITQRGDRKLCGEIIELHSKGAEAGIIGSIMPLLVPDVPVFLWVLDAVPCGNELFADFMDATNYVIIDSRRFPDLKAGLESAMVVCVGGEMRRGVQDLAWTSLQPWQELTAQHFDSARTRPCLSKIAKIVVSFGFGEREKEPSSAPLLFVAWLAGRTGIRVESLRREDGGEFVAKGVQEDHEVEVRLVPEPRERSEFEPGQMASVLIQCGAESGTARFAVESVSGSEIAAKEECAGVCFPPRVLEIVPQKEAALVAQALDLQTTNGLYADAVRIATEMLKGEGIGIRE